MTNASKYQRAIYKAFQMTDKNLSISAVAGSGKTTTLLELLKYVPQQSSSLFLAFNNSIVDELRKRNEREGINILTIHSCGWRMLLRTFGSKIKMNPNKGIAKAEKVVKELKIPATRVGYYFYIIPRMLDLMRCNLCDPTEESIDELIDKYNIDVEREDYKAILLADAEKEALSDDAHPYVSNLHKLVNAAKINIVARDVTKAMKKVKSLFSLNDREHEVTNDSVWHDIYGMTAIRDSKIAEALAYCKAANEKNAAVDDSTAKASAYVAIMRAYQQNSASAAINAALG